MKKYYLFALLLSMCSFGFVGCSDDDDVVTPEVEAPVVKVAPETVEIEAEGGAAAIMVTIENAIAEAKISVEPATAPEWIEMMVMNDKIALKVSANTEEQGREAKFTVKYPKAEDAHFMVKQAGTAKVEAPVVKVEPMAVEAAAEGGAFTINYSVENPVEGTQLEVENTAEWISEVNVAADKISFVVAVNEAEAERNAELTAKYAGAEDVKIAVKQTAGAAKAFVVEVKDIAEIGVTVSVKAKDKEMRYIAQTFYTEMVNQFPEDAALVANDKRYFETMAEDYMLPFDELMESNSQVGDQELPVDGLVPGRKYTTYVYGVSLPDFTQLTEVTRVEFETKAVAKQDIKFDIKASAESIYVDLNIQPVNYDGLYSYDVVELPASLSDEAVKTRLEEEWYQMVALYLMFGETPESISNSFCMSGECVWNAEKDANKNYVAYAYAVDGKTAFIQSDVQFVRVKTGDVAPSENVITIGLKDVTPFSATATFEPSNDDPYAMIALSDDEIKDIPAEELLPTLVTLVNFGINGYFETPMAGLMPGTSYHIYAFGYQSAAATTDLFELMFTTPAAQESTGKAELNYGKFYDALRVGELDSDYDNQAADGTAFIPIDFVFDEGMTFYSAFFTQKEADSFTDDMKLMTNIMDRFGPTDVRVPYAILRAPYDMTIVGVAFGIDAEGKVTKLFRGAPLTIDRDLVGDAQELVDNYPWPNPDNQVGSARPERSIMGNADQIAAAKQTLKMNHKREAMKANLSAKGARVLSRVMFR